MKKLIFVFALLIQTSFVFATDNRTNSKVVMVRYENVKMYQQPGTSTQILKSLKVTDEVLVVRKYNNYWTIVTVNDVPGYILTSELMSAKAKTVNTLARK